MMGIYTYKKKNENTICLSRIVTKLIFKYSFPGSLDEINGFVIAY